MEVCPSSYRQNLFLDPIALHFLNLETSATRLARVLLVIPISIHYSHYIIPVQYIYHQPSSWRYRPIWLAWITCESPRFFFQFFCWLHSCFWCQGLTILELHLDQLWPLGIDPWSPPNSIHHQAETAPVAGRCLGVGGKASPKSSPNLGIIGSSSQAKWKDRKQKRRPTVAYLKPHEATNQSTGGKLHEILGRSPGLCRRGYLALLAKWSQIPAVRTAPKAFPSENLEGYGQTLIVYNPNTHREREIYI